MIIVFIALVYLSNLATKQINDGISEFQSPCIPAGPTGDVGWTRSASGSISTCDISNNSSSPDFVKNLLNDMVFIRIYQEMYKQRLKFGLE